MKRLSLLISVIIICVNVVAQNYNNIELFRNEKLGVFHTIKLDGVVAGDALPLGHYVSFDNYTNNNIRVTYKVTVRVLLKKKSSFKDFTYTNTVYIKPKSSTIDFLTDNGILDFMQSNSPDMYIENHCGLLLRDFDMINYGVEKKNYETSY